MPTSTRSSVRTWAFRVLNGLGVLLLACAAWLAWWAPRHGEAWVDRMVEERIHAAIDQASVPGYRFTLASVKADARHGRLLVTGAELSFEPRLLDSLRTGAYRYLFAAQVDTVDLRGLSFRRLLLHGEFNVGAIELARPSFHYYTGPRRVDLADPFKRLGGGAGLVSVLFADTLTVRRASASVQDLGQQLPELDVAGLDLGGTAVRISALGQRSGVRLAVGDAELHVDSLGTQLPDGGHLHIGPIDLSRSTGTGRLADIRLVPPAEDSTGTHRVRRSVLALTADSILLAGLDLDRSIADEALRIGSMAILGMKATVTLDKTLPAAIPKPVQLPPAALLGMPFSIRLDTMAVVDASVRYRERDPRSRRWGEVPFTRLNGRFLNITNDADAVAAGERITGAFTCTFFDSGRVAGHYAAALDGSGRFSVEATAAGLPLVELNAATRPLMRMQVESGALNRMELRLEGNDERAKGSMALDYEGLLVRVEPGTPADLRHSLFGNVMDAMLSRAYGGALSADRERTFTVARDTNRSVFTYLWHATREGLTRNLVPEAKERMRTMLRTDAEQRREERALRKARKEASK